MSRNNKKHNLTSFTPKTNRSAIETLNTELRELYNTLVPSKRDIQHINNLVNKIKRLIEDKEDDFRVFVAGPEYYSCFSKDTNITFILSEKGSTYCKKLTSLTISKKQIPETREQRTFERILTILKNNDLIYTNTIKMHLKGNNVSAVSKTKRRNYKLCFSYQNDTLHKHQKHIEETLGVQKGMKPLFCILKFFMSLRSSSSSNHRSVFDYVLFLMLHSFYNLHPIVKNLGAIDNLGVLFMDFFQFYGLSFPYNSVTIDKNGNYMPKIQKDIYFSIIDPTSNNEIGHILKTGNKLRQIFEHNYQLMHCALTKKGVKHDSFCGLWFGTVNRITQNKNLK